MFFRSDVERLFNRNTDDFFTLPVKPDDRVIEHLKLLAVNVGLENFRTGLTFPFEDDPLRRSEQL
jgi:hypothetical protein